MNDIIIRIKEYARQEPARVREFVRAAVILVAVAIGVSTQSEIVISATTLATLIVSAWLQNGTRNNVTPIDKTTGNPVNEDYVRLNKGGIIGNGDASGVLD